MLRFLLSIIHQKHLGSDFYPLVCHHRVSNSSLNLCPILLVRSLLKFVRHFTSLNQGLPLSFQKGVGSGETP